VDCVYQNISLYILDSGTIQGYYSSVRSSDGSIEGLFSSMKNDTVRYSSVGGSGPGRIRTLGSFKNAKSLSETTFFAEHFHCNNTYF
jgi:hypothetical protein